MSAGFVEQGPLAARIDERLARVAPVPLEPGLARRLSGLLAAAVAEGARLVRGTLPLGAATGPLLLTGADPASPLLREGAFAPLACLVPVGSTADALAGAAQSPYALGAAVAQAPPS